VKYVASRYVDISRPVLPPEQIPHSSITAFPLHSPEQSAKVPSGHPIILTQAPPSEYIGSSF
jgi:hypothetical protein